MHEPRKLLDPKVGAWVNERLTTPDARGVAASAVIPTGFDHVVRVFHPAGASTWAEVAQQAGRVMHPLAQWGSISPKFDGRGRNGDEDPDEGSVPVETLAAILDHCPSDGELIQGVWAGFGAWESAADPSTLLPGWGGRDYLLFATPHEAIVRWPGMSTWVPQSANLIWPRDHAWCIATEIDWDFTLVAGSTQLAASIVGDSRLEAALVSYDDDLSWYGDTVNPLPAHLDRDE